MNFNLIFINLINFLFILYILKNFVFFNYFIIINIYKFMHNILCGEKVIIMVKKFLYILSCFALVLLGVGINFVWSDYNNDQSVSIAETSSSASIWDGSVPTDILTSDYAVVGTTSRYIYSAKGFAYFMQAVNSGTDFSDKTIFLETDIDLNGYDWNGIGTSSNAFNGTFDGKGHVIYNLVSSQGLFVYISNATVENLGVINASITSTGDCAVFAKSVTNSQINSCYAYGQIETSANAGGLIGTLYSSKLSSSFSNVKIVSSLNAGGLIYYSEDSTIESSYSSSNLNSTNNAGGLVCILTSTTSSIVKNCYFNGDISACNASGGVLLAKNVKISHFYSKGVLEATNIVASIFSGYSSIDPIVMNANVDITDSYSIVDLSGNTLIDNHDILGHVYYKSNSVNQDGYLVNLEDISTNYAFFLSTYYFSSLWSLTTESAVWQMDSDGNLLIVECEIQDRTKSQTSSFEGMGTFSNPYKLQTATDLGYLSYLIYMGNVNYSSAWYSLENDIDMQGRNFTPIGYSGNAFGGVFLGNNHRIDNLAISQISITGGATGGLFGYTSGAIIEDIIIGQYSVISASSSFIYSTEDTFLINCKDENISSINIYSGNLSIAYGQNNLIDNSYSNYLTTRSAVDKKEYIVAGLNTQGGIVYYNTTSIVKGQARVVLDISGTTYSIVKVETSLSNDPSFVTEFPTRNNFVENSSYYVIYEGYKLNSLSVSGKEILTISELTNLTKFSYTSASDVIANGIDFNYEENTYTLKIIFNAYEKNSGFVDNYYSETINVLYDAPIHYSQINNLLLSQTLNSTSYKRDGYIIEGIYRSISPDNLISFEGLGQNSQYQFDNDLFYINELDTSENAHFNEKYLETGCDIEDGGIFILYVRYDSTELQKFELSFVTPTETGGRQGNYTDTSDIFNLQDVNGDNIVQSVSVESLRYNLYNSSSNAEYIESKGIDLSYADKQLKKPEETILNFKNGDVTRFTITLLDGYALAVKDSYSSCIVGEQIESGFKDDENLVAFGEYDYSYNKTSAKIKKVNGVSTAYNVYIVYISNLNLSKDLNIRQLEFVVYREWLSITVNASYMTLGIGIGEDIYAAKGSLNYDSSILYKINANQTSEEEVTISTNPTWEGSITPISDPTSSSVIFGANSEYKVEKTDYPGGGITDDDGNYIYNNFKQYDDDQDYRIVLYRKVGNEYVVYAYLVYLCYYHGQVYYIVMYRAQDTFSVAAVSGSDEFSISSVISQNVKVASGTINKVGLETQKINSYVYRFDFYNMDFERVQLILSSISSQEGNDSGLNNNKNQIITIYVGTANTFLEINIKYQHSDGTDFTEDELNNLQSRYYMQVSATYYKSTDDSGQFIATGTNLSRTIETETSSQSAYTEVNFFNYTWFIPSKVYIFGEDYSNMLASDGNYSNITLKNETTFENGEIYLIEVVAVEKVFHVVIDGIDDYSSYKFDATTNLNNDDFGYCFTYSDATLELNFEFGNEDNEFVAFKQWEILYLYNNEYKYLSSKQNYSENIYNFITAYGTSYVNFDGGNYTIKFGYEISETSFKFVIADYVAIIENYNGDTTAPLQYLYTNKVQYVYFESGETNVAFKYHDSTNLNNSFDLIINSSVLGYEFNDAKYLIYYGEKYFGFDSEGNIAYATNTTLSNLSDGLKSKTHDDIKSYIKGMAQILGSSFTNVSSATLQIIPIVTQKTLLVYYLSGEMSDGTYAELGEYSSEDLKLLKTDVYSEESEYYSAMANYNKVTIYFGQTFSIPYYITVNGVQVLSYDNEEYGRIGHSQSGNMQYNTKDGIFEKLSSTTRTFNDSFIKNYALTSTADTNYVAYYVAYYSVKTYKIIINLNGGTYTPNANSKFIQSNNVIYFNISYGQKLSDAMSEFDTSVFVKQGNYLSNVVGFYLDEENYIYYDGDGKLSIYLVDYAYDLVEDLTLTLNWEAKSYTLKFNANGGEFSGDSTITISYGQDVLNLVLPDVYRYGYEFLAYSILAKNGTSIIYNLFDGMLDDNGKLIVDLTDENNDLSAGDGYIYVYARYKFDSNILSSTNAESSSNFNQTRQYNGQDNSLIYISDYGFNMIDSDENDILARLVNYQTSIKYTILKDTYDSLEDVAFSYSEAGEYQISLIITFTDDSKILNIGSMSITIKFNLIVSAVAIDFNQDLYKDAKVLTLKSIVSKIGDDEIIETLKNVSNFDSFAQVTDEADVENYLDFLLMKYYYELITQTDKDIYLSLAYDETIDYSDEYSDIIAGLNFITYYENDNTSIIYNNLGSIDEEFGITVKQVTFDSTASLGISDVKVYLNGIDNNNFENFTGILKNSEGYYIYLSGVSSILPEVLYVHLTENDGSFYTGTNQNVEYINPDGFEVSMLLQTSNVGAEDIDTQFLAFDKDNYFNYYNVDIKKDNVIVTIFYRVFVAREDIYTIFATQLVGSDVDVFTFDARLYTVNFTQLNFNDKVTYDLTIYTKYGDGDEEYYSVTYTKIDTIENLLVKVSSVLPLFQIENLNNGEVLKVYIRKYVFYYFMIKVRSTDQNAIFYTETATAIQSLDEEVYNSEKGESLFIYNCEEFLTNEEERFKIVNIEDGNRNYYEFFTDVVNIKYDFGDYVINLNTNVQLTRGQSTIANIYSNISRVGFKTLTTQDKNDNNSFYSVIINGNNYSFSVLFDEDILTINALFVTLSVNWQLAELAFDEIITEFTEVAQLDTSFNLYALSNFSSSNYILALSSGLYSEDIEYTFEYKDADGTIISTQESITLPSLIESSGEYTLTIYASYNDQQKTYTQDFSINIIIGAVSQVVFTADLGTYNGQDKINSIYVTIKFTYEDTKYEDVIYYCDDYFNITLNGQKVTSIVNAGIYEIELNSILSQIYDFGENQISYEATMVAYALEQKIYSVKYGHELPSTTIQFSGVIGETIIVVYEQLDDVTIGQHFLEIESYTILNAAKVDITSENENYVIPDVLVIEIIQADLLRIYIGSNEEGDDFSTITPQIYNSSIYEFNLDFDKNNVKLMQNETIQIGSTLSLHLVDDYSLNEVSVENLTDFQYQFGAILSGAVVNYIKSVGVYTLYLTGSCNEYKYIELYETYNFEIKPITIYITELSYEYMGSLTCSIILDESYGVIQGDDVQLIINASSIDAGEGRQAYIVLSGDDAGNYVLSSSLVSLTITKKQAELEIIANQESFVYGDIKYSNLDSYFTLKVDDLVTNYEGKLQVNEEVVVNSSGYMFVGTYTINVDDITYKNYEIINNPIYIFTIETYSYEVTYITRIHEQLISADLLFEQSYSIGTGDVFTLKFSPNKEDFVEKSDEIGNYYDLVIYSSEFSEVQVATNFNIINSLSKLYVIAQGDDPYVLAFEDSENNSFTQTYANKEFIVKLCLEAGTFYIRLYRDTELIEKRAILCYTDITKGTEVSNYNGDFSESTLLEGAKDVGIYLFDSLANFVLADIPYLKITSKVISLNSEYEKEYDSSTDYESFYDDQETGEKVEFILTASSVNVGTYSTSNNTLFVAILNSNYLCESDIVLTINKNTDEIILYSKITATYGTISFDYAIDFDVYKGEVSEDNLLSVSASGTIIIEKLDDTSEDVYVSAGIYQFNNNGYSYSVLNDGGINTIGNAKIVAYDIQFANYSNIKYEIEITIDRKIENLNFYAGQFIYYREDLLNVDEESRGIHKEAILSSLGEALYLNFNRGTNNILIGYYSIESVDYQSDHENPNYVLNLENGYAAIRIIVATSLVQIRIVGIDEQYNSVSARYEDGILHVVYNGAPYEARISLSEAKIYFYQNNTIVLALSLYIFTDNGELTDFGDITAKINFDSSKSNTTSGNSADMFDISKNSGTTYEYVQLSSECRTIYFYIDNATVKISGTIYKIYDKSSSITLGDILTEYRDFIIIEGLVANDRIENYGLVFNYIDEYGDSVVDAGESYFINVVFTSTGNYSFDTSALVGVILKKELSITLGENSYVYGNDNLIKNNLNLEYKIFEDDVDITNEVVSGVPVFEGKLSVIASDFDYSTSNHLNVGSYLITCEDIKSINYSVIINTESYVTVSKLVLYTDEKIAKIYDGSLDIDISSLSWNWIYGDDVSITHAQFSSSLPGTEIEVTAELIGADADNYELSQLYGTIYSRTIELVYCDTEYASTSPINQIYDYPFQQVELSLIDSLSHDFMGYVIYENGLSQSEKELFENNISTNYLSVQENNGYYDITISLTSEVANLLNIYVSLKDQISDVQITQIEIHATWQLSEFDINVSLYIGASLLTPESASMINIEGANSENTIERILYIVNKVSYGGIINFSVGQNYANLFDINEVKVISGAETCEGGYKITSTANFRIYLTETTFTLTIELGYSNVTFENSDIVIEGQRATLTANASSLLSKSLNSLNPNLVNYNFIGYSYEATGDIIDSSINILQLNFNDDGTLTIYANFTRQQAEIILQVTSKLQIFDTQGQDISNQTMLLDVGYEYEFTLETNDYLFFSSLSNWIYSVDYIDLEIENNILKVTVLKYNSQSLQVITKVNYRVAFMGYVRTSDDGEYTQSTGFIINGDSATSATYIYEGEYDGSEKTLAITTIEGFDFIEQLMDMEDVGISINKNIVTISEQISALVTISVYMQAEGYIITIDNADKISVLGITDTTEIYGTVNGEYCTLVVPAMSTLTLEITICDGYTYISNSISGLYGTSVYQTDKKMLVIDFTSISNNGQISLTLQAQDIKITIEYDEHTLIDDFIYSNVKNNIENILTVTADSEISIISAFEFGYKLYSVELKAGDDVVGEISFVDNTISISRLRVSATLYITSTEDDISFTIINQTYDCNGNLISVNGNNAYAILSLDDSYADSVTKAQFNTFLFIKNNCESGYLLEGYQLNGENLEKTGDYYGFTLTEANMIITAIFSVYYVDVNVYGYEINSSGQLTQSSNVTLSESSARFYYKTEQAITISIQPGYEFNSVKYMLMSDYTIYTLASTTFDNNVVSITFTEEIMQLQSVRIVVKAKEILIKVTTTLSYLNTVTETLEIGSVYLTDTTSSYNRYGSDSYSGTSSVYDENGTYPYSYYVTISTGGEFGLQIYQDFSGYSFLSVEKVSNTSISSSLRAQGANSSYFIYSFYNIVATEDSVIEILIKYTADIHQISFNFVNDEGVTVTGGRFRIGETNKVTISDNMTSYSSVFVTSDAVFTVEVFVLLGYTCEDSYINYSEGFELLTSNFKLESTTSGYYASFTLEIENITADGWVQVVVIPNKYSVALYDRDEDQDILIATIHRVAFGSVLNLLETNSENIEIGQNSYAYFADGTLCVLTEKVGYVFKGYFTKSLGAGRNYISSSGIAVNPWNETGYILVDGNYVLSDAELDENGDIIIKLYAYWYHAKTTITLKVTPDAELEIDINDVVSGVDSNNSYKINSSTIEIDPNTNFTISAPIYDNYHISKWVIEQITYDGMSLGEQEYTGRILDITLNPSYSIEFCYITLIYKVKINLNVVGGVLDYIITQNQNIIIDDFVDIDSEFNISFYPRAGYDFVRAIYNIEYTSPSLYITYTSAYTVKNSTIYVELVAKAVQFQIICEDEFGVVSGYSINEIKNQTNITTLIPMDGIYDTSYNANIRIGVSLQTLGYKISWDSEKIIFSRSSGNIFTYYFVVDEDMLEELNVFTFNISPQNTHVNFTSSVLSQDVLDIALDDNDVNYFGYVSCRYSNSNSFDVQFGADVIFDITVYERYKLVSTIVTYYNGIEATSYDLIDDVTANSFIVTADMLITNNSYNRFDVEFVFARDYWINHTSNALYGLGTNSNPFLITSASDLALVSYLVNYGVVNNNGVKYADLSYKLTTNIDMEEYFFEPIGNNENVFYGKFDFGEYDVMNINLFTTYEGGTIHNGLFWKVGSEAQITRSKHISLLWIILIIILLIILLLIIILLIIRKLKKDELNRLENETNNQNVSHKE